MSNSHPEFQSDTALYRKNTVDVAQHCRILLRIRLITSELLCGLPVPFVRGQRRHWITQLAAEQNQIEDCEKCRRVGTKSIGMPLTDDRLALIMLDIRNGFEFIRVVHVGK